MALSSRITQLAQHLASYFTVTQADLASSLRAGYEGELAVYRFGKNLVFLSYSVRRTDGGALGATTSVTELATLPAAWTPVRTASSAGKYSTPGSGYSSGTISLSAAGRLDTTGQPSGATTVSGGMLYFRV